MCVSLSITGTFKHQKVELRNEGFNPSVVKDPLFSYDFQKKKYVPFTATEHAAVSTPKAKL